MEDHAIVAIENAAHAYVDARDARMSMSKTEQQRHTKLIAVMQQNGKRKYAHRNGEEVIEVEVQPKDATAKAKVRIVSIDDYGKKTKRSAPAQEPVIEGDEPELQIDEVDSDNPDDEIDDDELDDENDDEPDDDEDEDEARE